MLSVKSLFGDTLFMSGEEGGVLLAVCIAAAVCTLAVIVLSIVVAVTLKRRKGEEEPVRTAPSAEQTAPAESAETPAAAPAPASETHGAPAAALAERGVRYNRSFAAKLIQSDDELKAWYSGLKNELLSYKKVKARRSWKRERYPLGRKNVVRFSFRGKTLCLYFALDPAQFEGTKYRVETAEDSANADTPCLYRLKNDRRVRYAKDLIAAAMERAGAVRNENYVPDDVTIPYEETETLIEEGLIKVIEGATGEAVSQETAEIAAGTSEQAYEPAEEVEEPVGKVTEESAEEAVEETAEVAEEVEEPAEEVSEEEPTEEPVAAETEVEELSQQELDDVQSYEEEERDEDGIEVVGVMFRHRGKKVYWFDPDGRTWKKGEIAIHIAPDATPQEVIVVDNAKLSPSKLHLPLKPLHKAPRRPQTR